MNIENIDKAIRVMERVRRLELELGRHLLDMDTFQDRPIENGSRWTRALQTEAEVLHTCGTTCCFSGWLAVAPEFPELVPDPSGAAVLSHRPCNPEESLAVVFQVSSTETYALIYGPIYTVEDVIDRLQSWKQGAGNEI